MWRTIFAVLGVLDFSLIKTEPGGYVMMAVTAINHPDDDGDIGRVYSKSASVRSPHPALHHFSRKKYGIPSRVETKVSVRGFPRFKHLHHVRHFPKL